MYRIIGADQQQYGPVTEAQLRQWIAEKRLTGQSLVMPEGGSEWKPLAGFSEFAELVGPPASPAIAPGMPSSPAFAPDASGPKMNGFAVAGFIFGIISFLGCCCCVPTWVPGLVFSLIGWTQIKNDPQRQTGMGFAIAGLVLSVASVVLGFIMGLVWSVMSVMPGPHGHGNW